MNHELFSATPFELHQSIAQHLPSGFASGPVFDAVQQGIKAVALAKKKALQYVCHATIGVGAGPVELQYEVSHAGEVDSLRVSKLSGDLGILNAFAAEMGCFVIPAPETQSGNIFKGLADTSREFGELVAQGQVVIARMAAMHEADKPSSSEKSVR